MGSGSIVPQTDRFVLSSTTASYGATLESNGTIMVTPTTYFPSALVASQAQPITIGSGEERAGVDIVLRTSSATFISGRLVGPDGPGADWALNLVPTDTGDLTSDPQVATAVTDSDGAFMFLGIPAGSYVIQGMRISPQAGPRVTTTVVNGQPMLLSMTASSPAAAQVPAQPTLWTATPVSVGPEGLRDLAVTLRRGFAVSGRVEFDGSAERPPAARLQTVTVTLEPADGRTRGAMPSARLDGSGQFTSGGYLPGKYVVRVLNPPGGWTLKSVMLGATDVADLPLELDARDLSGLVVTFVDRSTELQGSVRDPQGSAGQRRSGGRVPARQPAVDERRHRVAPPADESRLDDGPLHVRRAAAGRVRGRRVQRGVRRRVAGRALHRAALARGDARHARPTAASSRWICHVRPCAAV